MSVYNAVNFDTLLEEMTPNTTKKSNMKAKEFDLSAKLPSLMLWTSQKKTSIKSITHYYESK